MSYTRLEVLCETAIAVEQFRTSSCIFLVFYMFHNKEMTLFIECFTENITISWLICFT